MLPLPVLAAAGAAVGWLVGRAAQGSEAAADDEPAAAATPAPGDATSEDGGTVSLDWGQDLSGGGGLLPGAGPVGGDDLGYDYGSGQYGPTPTPTPTPHPTPTPTPTPAPAPPPAPAPGTLYGRPSAAPPSGAVGWVVLFAGTTYWDPVAGWAGGYPVRLRGQSTYQNTTTRYVSGAKNAIKPNGQTISVRRTTHSGSIANQWAKDFIGATSRKVYPLSTKSVRL